MAIAEKETKRTNGEDELEKKLISSCCCRPFAILKIQHATSIGSISSLPTERAFDKLTLPTAG